MQQHQQQQPPRFAPHVSTTSVMAHSNGISSSSGLTSNPSLNNNVFDSNHSGGGVNGHSEYILQKKNHFRKSKYAYLDIFKSIWLFQKRQEINPFKNHEVCIFWDWKLYIFFTFQIIVGVEDFCPNDSIQHLWPSDLWEIWVTSRPASILTRNGQMDLTKCLIITLAIVFWSYPANFWP